MKIELRKETKQFTGDVWWKIYVDGSIKECRVSEMEAKMIFNNLKNKAQLHPVTVEETIYTFETTL